MLVLLSCHNEQRDRLWCWCSWSLKNLLKVVFRGTGERMSKLTLCDIRLGDWMRERKNEEGVKDFSCCWWSNVNVLAPFDSCSKLHSEKSHGSVNFWFCRIQSRLRASLKLHKFRLSPKSNRHEYESARRPSELANATLFVKNVNYSSWSRWVTSSTYTIFIFLWFHKNFIEMKRWFAPH